MSWDSYRTSLVEKYPNIFESLSIWGTNPISPWTQADPKFTIQEADIKILKDGHSKFCENGPVLMGTKFIFASDKLQEPDNMCMTLKAKTEEAPFFIVFGFTKKAIVVAKVISSEPKSAVVPLYGLISYLMKQSY